MTYVIITASPSEAHVFGTGRRWGCSWHAIDRKPCRRITGEKDGQYRSRTKPEFYTQIFLLYCSEPFRFVSILVSIIRGGSITWYIYLHYTSVNTATHAIGTRSPYLSYKVKLIFYFIKHCSLYWIKTCSWFIIKPSYSIHTFTTNCKIHLPCHQTPDCILKMMNLLWQYILPSNYCS